MILLRGNALFIIIAEIIIELPHQLQIALQKQCIKMQRRNKVVNYNPGDIIF